MSSKEDSVEGHMSDYTVHCEKTWIPFLTSVYQSVIKSLLESDSQVQHVDICASSQGTSS